MKKVKKSRSNQPDQSCQSSRKPDSPGEFFSKKGGCLVIFEGIDASGKSTQLNLLKDYLKEKRIDFSFFKFPRHGQSVFGQVVDEYLAGRFGKASEQSPYLSALIFAADRFENKEKIKQALKENKLVIIDRYTNSSVAYEGAKLKDSKQIEALGEWIRDLEFNQMGMPRPDKVIYFKVDFSVTEKLLKREDDLEKNSEFLKKVKENYETIAKKGKEWHIIEGSKKGKMLSREEIFEKIKNLLKI